MSLQICRLITTDLSSDHYRFVELNYRYIFVVECVSVAFFRSSELAMKNSKTELVVKCNRMIEASYRLNLVEQQIVLFAICRSREKQKGFSSDVPVTITAADFAAQFGTNTDRVYAQLKEALNALYARSVTLHDIDPVSGQERVTETRWISEKSYIDGTGQVQLTFTPRVIPFITRLGGKEGFTSYRLEKIGGMTSSHAVRLYELLIQYLGIGRRTIEIAWLKETLAISDEYPRLDNLKRRVIDVAVSQINEHSDIRTSYTQQKTGRSVTHLIFNIKPKAKPTKIPKIDKQYIEANAHPGESYDAAYRRLLEESGQQRINV